MITIDSIRNGSSGNLYVVKNNDTKFLLEFGFGINKAIELLADDYHLADMQACLISHCHSDHSLGLKDITYLFPIYCNKQTAEQRKVPANLIEHNSKINIGSVRAKAISVEHGQTDNLGFIFKDDDSSALFITDFHVCKHNLSNFKFNEIYVECNYDNETLQSMMPSDEVDAKFTRQFNTHMSVENLIVFLKGLDLTCCHKISLVHLSRFCSRKKNILDKLQKEFPGMKFEFAKGGN